MKTDSFICLDNAIFGDIKQPFSKQCRALVLGTEITSTCFEHVTCDIITMNQKTFQVNSTSQHVSMEKYHTLARYKTYWTLKLAHNKNNGI